MELLALVAWFIFSMILCFVPLMKLGQLLRISVAGLGAIAIATVFVLRNNGCGVPGQIQRLLAPNFDNTQCAKGVGVEGDLIFGFILPMFALLILGSIAWAIANLKSK